MSAKLLPVWDVFITFEHEIAFSKNISSNQRVTRTASGWAPKATSLIVASRNTHRTAISVKVSYLDMFLQAGQQSMNWSEPLKLDSLG
jgi:hypothetical protein